MAGLARLSSPYERRMPSALAFTLIHGKGHLTRVIGNTDVLWVAVQMAGESLPLTA